MKKNLWERLLPRPHKSHFLTLSAVLALSPLVGTEYSHAAGSAIVTTPVVNKDVQWIHLNSGSVMDGNTIAIDISNHTHLQTESGMTLSASSKDSSASARIDGNMLKVTVLSAGTATIELTAEKAGRTTAIDTLQFNIIRIGDTNGDGNVTSADALYITKIANTTPPITDPIEINRLDINRDGKVSKEDATALLTNYVGKSGTVASTFIVNIVEINDKPLVTQSHVDGQLKLNEVLEIMPEYQDVEGDLADVYSYQWYRGKDPDGSSKQAIDGATSKQYTVHMDDVGKYLFVAVTPSAQTGVKYGDTSIWTSPIPVPDTTPPELSQPLQPLLQMTKAAMSSDFVMVFNEPVKASTGNITLRKKADQSIIQSFAATDEAKVKIHGETVEIVKPKLADVTDYYIEVDPTAIQDFAGNNFAGLSGSTSWGFTTPDTTAPIVTGLLPGNSALDVVKNAALRITFNEAVKAVSGKTITIYKADQTEFETISVEDTSKVTITGTEVTIQHENFSESENYYAFVEAGAFTDLSDNVFAGITNNSAWAFEVPDVTDPEAKTLYPQNNGKNINVTDDFHLNFNEAVTAVSGKQIKVYDANTHSEVATLDVDDSSQVTITNNEVVFQIPGLQNDKSYYIEVDSGAFKDNAGNPAVAIGGISDWKFATPDTLAPTVTAYSPLPNGMTESKDSALTLTFSEDIKADATKMITINKSSDDEKVIDFYSTDPDHVARTNNLVTLSNLNLEENGSYYIAIAEGAFTDYTGNRYAGMSGKTDWAFATPDTTAPTISLLSPANLATHVTLSAPLEVTFNENVKAVSDKTVSILKYSDNSVVATYSATDTTKVSVSGKVVTIVNPGLSDETTYYLKMDNGAFADLSDNAFEGISTSATWSFSTPDTTPPKVAQLTPNNQASEVSKSADFSVVFNENIQAVAGKMIDIYKTSDHSSAIVSYDISDTNHVTINGKTLTIKNPGLDDFTQYDIDIAEDALEDMSGNKFIGLVGTTSWSFWSPDTRTFTSTNFEDFTENQLAVTGGTILDLIITGDTFKDGLIVDEPNSLSVDDFVLNNAPSGLSILSADKVDDHEVYLALDYDGTDFDTDITNFSVTIRAEALAAGSSLTSPDTTITATVEPNIVSTDPVTATQTNTHIKENLSVNFSEPVTAVSGKQITIYKKSDDSIVQQIDAGDTSKVTVTGSTASIQHVELAAVTDYYMLIEKGAFLDLENNPNAGITTKTQWSFTTLGLINTVNISPANGSSNVNKSGDLTMTFDSDVTGVAGKKIKIYKKADDSLVDTIDAGDTSKVTTSNSVATIKHVTLMDQSEYYVIVEGGAFKDVQGKLNTAITAKTDWALKTVVYNPGPFITDFVDGGDGRIALEMANLPNSAGYGGYQLWVYKYMENTGTMKIDKFPLFAEVNKDLLYIFIGTIFYDAMDIMNIWYYNDEIDAYNPASFTVNAYVITDASGKAIDVLGDPTAVTANAFLPNGGTLVRKPSMGGGVSTYLPFQWNEYSKGNFQYFGTHTN